jgi:hypothetical protein
VRAKVILRERDRERRVGGQVEFGIPLAPVSVLMRGWLVNVDPMLVCLAIGVFLNILDDSDIDGGESARAVDLFGWHGYGCVNVCGRVVDLDEGLETYKGNPTRLNSFHFRLMQGRRCRPLPYSNLISPFAVSAYPTPSFAEHIIILRVHLATFATASHNHENRRYGPRGQVPCR